MAKSVILNFDQGDFQQGFNLKIQIYEESDNSLLADKTGKFHPAENIPKLYDQWSLNHQKLDSSRRDISVPEKGKSFNTESICEQCNESASQFINAVKNWLELSEWPEFNKFKQELHVKLNQQEAIRVLIKTDNFYLQRLPWHEWNLFADIYTHAEIALCPTESEKPSVEEQAGKSVVKILAILGNSEGIDIGKDTQYLRSLKGADVEFKKEPQYSEISDSLWQQKWDILFFAGHSSSQFEKGKIFINRTESLTIEQLKCGLRKAIKNGLQLAIFNSCDGLKLAEDLVAELHIPQVIVMREPVPDQVAQDFLKFFLEAFVGGDSLYLAVRHARERLRETGWDKKYPGASWLPVIYQNRTMTPPTWKDLTGPEKNYKVINFKMVIYILLITILPITLITLKTENPPDVPAEKPENPSVIQAASAPKSSVELTGTGENENPPTDSSNIPEILQNELENTPPQAVLDAVREKLPADEQKGTNTDLHKEIESELASSDN